MVVPIVAATGIVVRNTADKFSTIAVDSDSLAQRSAIYDREGHLITYVWNVDLGAQMTYENGIDRQPVNYNQISPNMLTAIVAIEDDRFWQHGALDVKGTIRALVNDIEHKPIQGGSTLEQQYVKNVLVLQASGQPGRAAGGHRRQPLPQARPAADGGPGRAHDDQAADPGRVPERLLLRQRRLGHRGGGRDVLQHHRRQAHPAQAATLAGIVENPTAYDPINNPANALARRNIVLARIGQTNPTALSPAAATVLIGKKLGLRPGAKQSGCTASTAGQDAFFCDYVVHAVLNDPQLGATTEDRAKLLSTGGLKIYTTLAPQDESAATHAVNYVVPLRRQLLQPANQNVDTTALVQPGTGKILAIAEDRQYGPNPNKGQTEVDYAVNSEYGGQSGVQTGSSSKLFTLLTALEQGVPFGLPGDGPELPDGLRLLRTAQATSLKPYPVVNSSASDKGTYTLYTGTADSINTFFAELEQKVGLCNVVHTAVALGMTRADGVSLLKA